ncbi:unnamed protein product [Paramecium sonneborni]|uniref:Palmitoyltransferase n=1 Tax=Paramecium sonneborni TaxID=65129 RepID=A0A8S1LQ20_9CILI|nr:unnamed protein product [Paramecium sonneborni]
MYREIQMQKILNNNYLLGVFFFIICIYIWLVCLTLIYPYSNTNTLIIQILWVPLQIFYIMVIWSMIRCIISDPGKVPIYWGVLLDDQEQKKRRYCLICHIFKPERCHHCSTCQRCVLNMDHHCPWIGNCVGYQNRKFFILFLLYINLSVLFGIAITSLRVYPIIMDLIYINWKLLIENYLVIPTLLLEIIIITFGGVISNFFVFHLDLVSTNKTTIDTLEVRRNGNPTQTPLNVYDIGIKENWLQVMGNNPWLWIFPMFGESGRPKGDGVRWERNQNQLTMTEQNVTHRTQTNQNQRSEMTQPQQRV